jgi:HK97 family phage portal protein
VSIIDWAKRTFGRPAITEAEASVPAPASVGRTGFEFGIGPSGLTEYNQQIGASTQDDRRSLMTQLYEVYLTCPWVWACANAISRTITAGGLQVDWVQDDDEGDQEKPTKPAEVLQLERLLQFCNPREDIRQLMRSVIADLLVFGDAFIEVVWVLGIPVALYSLDSPSTTPLADQHGEITGYVQITDYGQRAEFESHEVIHISLDSPRSGVFGVSPTQASMMPVLTWLYTAATLKETFRKGNPPPIHVDHPASSSDPDVKRWGDQYMTRNIGPRNIGRPVITKGGATVNELQANRIAEYLDTLSQKRDEIISTFGVPPAEVGIIESGNLGGGTGESQRKSYLLNTCNPIAGLVLEKINFHIVQRGFRIDDSWRLKFGEIDMRDSKIIEEIRGERIKTAQYTINRARAEIGEPPIEGGDVPLIWLRDGVLAVRDVVPFSTAGIAAKLRGTALEPDEPAGDDSPVTLHKPEPAEVPDQLKPFAGVDNPDPTADGGQPDNPDQPPKAGSKAGPVRESHRSVYRRRLAEALKEMPDVDTRAAA